MKINPMQYVIFILKNRVARQWLLTLVVVATIGLGWKYYWISFSVPLVMIANMSSTLLSRGRFVCGNFCPRGAFYDRVLSLFSSRRNVPVFFKRKDFRWFFFAFVFGFFFFQVLRSPELTLERFGHIFWLMCTVTTVLGIILSIFFSYRTWCAFCPVGTFLSTFGKDNYPFFLDESLCCGCKACNRACPLNIGITWSLDRGKLNDSDCIKCMQCMEACPKKAIKFSDINDNNGSVS